MFLKNIVAQSIISQSFGLLAIILYLKIRSVELAVGEVLA
jgi:hypothetical protein